MDTKHIAKQLRDVYFGGNWATSNLKQHLVDVTWQQATTSIYSCNSIATLAYHMTYYVREVAKVLEGEPLLAKDKFSFEHPPIESQEDWDAFLEKIWEEAEHFAKLIEAFPEDKLWQPFFAEQYGNYYCNLCGIIEHLHYHLGQVVVLKKILLQKAI